MQRAMTIERDTEKEPWTLFFKSKMIKIVNNSGPMGNDFLKSIYKDNFKTNNLVFFYMYIYEFMSKTELD